MPDHVHENPKLIFSAGTQVVVLRDITADGGRLVHPRGAVGVVVRAPADLQHPYRVRFLDGVEEPLGHADLMMLARYKEGDLGGSSPLVPHSQLFSRVIYRCIIGSRAYGLEGADSDTDYRGVYLPRPAEHWSLYGVPDQIENQATQEQYWELQRFLVLALKANPNVLECLYTPLVEQITPLAEELRGMREVFLSRLVFQTYSGYVASQFRKMQADVRNQGQVKWKHVMHLLRLLISGIVVLREGTVPVDMTAHREQLLAVKRGEVAWDETEAWRQSLQREFENAAQQTTLPERPDYERANTFLIKARAAALHDDLP